MASAQLLADARRASLALDVLLCAPRAKDTAKHRAGFGSQVNMFLKRAVVHAQPGVLFDAHNLRLDPGAHGDLVDRARCPDYRGTCLFRGSRCNRTEAQRAASLINGTTGAREWALHGPPFAVLGALTARLLRPGREVELLTSALTRAVHSTCARNQNLSHLPASPLAPRRAT